jgi:16S rRNA (cytosine967-C5)-methyltransferase
MKYDNQLRYASNIIEDYKGEKPLAAWLKEFFRANKQMGSNDRKTVADLLYNYYRLGHALKTTPNKQKILAGLFLCNESPIALLAHFKPEWNERISLPLPEKILLLNNDPSLLPKFSVNEIFPWHNELSEGIDYEAFSRSFLIQPDLFLRIRPGKADKVKDQLEKANISFNLYPPSTVALTNSTKLDEVIETDQDAVVQDYNSQKAGELITRVESNLQPKIKVWDSCAASGGKSIMAFDINPAIQLTVSDVRESIIENLHKRFQRAGIKNYTSFVTDLSQRDSGISSTHPVGNTKFDLIIADLPCSGSGTWSRTPEQLYFFKPEKIIYYSSLQKRIIDRVLPALKKGGVLLYITCSVFKKENEEVVNYITKGGLTLKHKEVLTGYQLKADSMFAAIFTL